MESLTIDELDPAQNRIGKDNLTKFLSDFDNTYMDRTKPKGPDYLIIDNILETFLERADLLAARSKAEEMTSFVCDELAKDSARCDNLIWIRNLDTTHGGDSMPGFSEIATAMKSFRQEVLNEIS